MVVDTYVSERNVGSVLLKSVSFLKIILFSYFPVWKEEIRLHSTFEPYDRFSRVMS